MHGLFVHGFKPGSKAEKEGLVRPGDEILMVEGVDVEACFLESLVAVLRHRRVIGKDFVHMRLRRCMALFQGFVGLCVCVCVCVCFCVCISVSVSVFVWIEDMRYFIKFVGSC